MGGGSFSKGGARNVHFDLPSDFARDKDQSKGHLAVGDGSLLHVDLPRQQLWCGVLRCCLVVDRDSKQQVCLGRTD